MFKKLLLPGLLLILFFALSACASPQPSPTPAPTATPPPTQDIAATQTAEAAANNNRVATSIAATLTALPTQTPLPTPTPLPTQTPLPTATATPKPSATPSPAPTSTATPAPTKVVAAATKAPPTSAPTKPAAAPSIYGYTSVGPQGYTSTLYCTQADKTECKATMAPGDLSFYILLESTADALRAIFYPFGLSVERDGVNVADMFMTVGAGWLEPGDAATLGTSTKFSVPGRYVVRSSGCLITAETVANCAWSTVSGTVLTFDIR